MQGALAQTFGSIEFLLIDDCGTDAGVDLVRTLQGTHERGKDIRIVARSTQPRCGSGTQHRHRTGYGQVPLLSRQ